MIRETQRKEVDQHPAVRNYMTVCLTALVVLLLALLARGLSWYSLLPILVGSLTLIARWQLAPLLLLIILMGMLHILSLRDLPLRPRPDCTSSRIKSEPYFRQRRCASARYPSATTSQDLP